MIDSMNRVEETREERMKEKIHLLTPDEKSDFLHRFHPDYKLGANRELKIGPNRGEMMVNEVADLLEAYSLVDEEFDLSTMDYDVDVLVIGGGGAGASAALLAQENGADVLLTTKLRLGDANTMMAQGGIQAADKSNDSPAIHYLDAMGGGGFHNVPALVRALVMDAPFAIEWLEDLGVMFDKEEDGTMITIHGGGTSRKRMHSCRDYSGGDIMKTLRDEVKNREIEVLEFSPVCELLTGNGRCTGAILYNMETEEYLIVRSKTTIIATGGAGRLHVQGFPTTNHYGATADGLVIAYRAGCRLLFMDTIQYHPTGAAFPEQIMGLLITEKCRGLGAQLVNKDGNRFIYELETRDAESAAIIRECTEGGKGVEILGGMFGVWLDLPLIEIINGEGTIQKEIPAMYRQYKRFGIDITQEPVLTYPTQHYQNGGIAINEKGETEVPNLYVAGEASGGVHGRNRLMGNSLLDIIVYGRRAGKNAALKAKHVEKGDLTLEHVKNYHSELEGAGIEKNMKSPMLLPDYRETRRRMRLL
jgi:succinate dehydrogenase / fumarate reductase flavoprotein subunit